jgi:hypothetical protein
MDEVRTYKRKQGLPEWVGGLAVAVVLVVLFGGIITLAIYCETKGREECPSCERQVKPKIYHDTETGTSSWKCGYCWFPIRTKEIKTTEEVTTNGVQ